ncbi:MAG: hypothetical protein WDA16_08100 [Candidatus Thermoplasmatota archaeon]
MFPRSPIHATPERRLATVASTARLDAWLSVLHEGQRALLCPRVSHSCAQYQHTIRESAEARLPIYATSKGWHSKRSPHVGHAMTARPSFVYPSCL